MMGWFPVSAVRNRVLVAGPALVDERAARAAVELELGLGQQRKRVRRLHLVGPELGRRPRQESGLVRYRQHGEPDRRPVVVEDRKSTRLNSSHPSISYA